MMTVLIALWGKFVDDAFLFTLLFRVFVVEVFFLDYVVFVDFLSINRLSQLFQGLQESLLHIFERLNTL